MTVFNKLKLPLAYNYTIRSDQYHFTDEHKYIYYNWNLIIYDSTEEEAIYACLNKLGLIVFVDSTRTGVTQQLTKVNHCNEQLASLSEGKLSIHVDKCGRNYVLGFRSQWHQNNDVKTRDKEPNYVTRNYNYQRILNVVKFRYLCGISHLGVPCV